MMPVLVGDYTAEDYPVVIEHVRAKVLQEHADECALIVQKRGRDRESGEITAEWVDVFLASRERREFWQVPIKTEQQGLGRNSRRLGKPEPRDFFPSNAAYVMFPLPYLVVSPGAEAA
jgi:hypothetical protein